MKFNTRIPEKLKPYFVHEVENYKLAMDQKDLQKAWHHLERAHILGQRYPWAHTFVHWEMMKFGFKIKNTQEILGQIPRLLVGGVKSFVGKIPVGNPGGANVPPLQPFPIEDEILEIFQKANVPYR
jgi:hypothetical protein